MGRGKARRRERDVDAAESVPAVAPRRRLLEVALVLLRHAAPLASLIVFRGSVHTYLLLALFDLGVGYAGHQLRDKPAGTRDALAAAHTRTERALAWFQLPMLMAFAGMLFVFTAMLFLLPFLAAFLWPPLAAAVKADVALIVASVAVTSIAGARQFDRALAAAGSDAPAYRLTGDRGARRALESLGLFLLLAGYALGFGGPSAGLWVLATLFTAWLCAIDLEWTPRWARHRKPS
jgi:hypothetical protein